MKNNDSDKNLQHNIDNCDIKEQSESPYQEELDKIEKEIKDINNKMSLLRKENISKIEKKAKKIKLKKQRKQLFKKRHEQLKNDPDYHANLEMKQLLGRTILFLGIALAFYILILLFAGEYLKIAGEWFSKYLGLAGVFAYVYIVDTLIVPTTADIIFTITQEWEPVSLLLVMCVASILGGFSGYLIGKKLNRFKFVRDVTASYQEIGSRIIKRYGIWAIVLAGLTPIPYSTISWIAGMLKLKKSHYILGSLSRIPRIITYYLLIKGGVTLFAQ